MVPHAACGGVLERGWGQSSMGPAVESPRPSLFPGLLLFKGHRCFKEIILSVKAASQNVVKPEMERMTVSLLGWLVY